MKTTVINVHTTPYSHIRYLTALESYVYIGRPSKWGNPFSHLSVSLAKFQVRNRTEAVNKFRDWVLTQPDLIAQAKIHLKGKHLGCYCAPQLCHGDIWAEIVDGVIPT